jgi:hypothetical protein
MGLGPSKFEQWKSIYEDTKIIDDFSNSKSASYKKLCKIENSLTCGTQKHADFTNAKISYLTGADSRYNSKREKVECTGGVGSGVWGNRNTVSRVRDRPNPNPNTRYRWQLKEADLIKEKLKHKHQEDLLLNGLATLNKNTFSNFTIMDKDEHKKFAEDLLLRAPKNIPEGLAALIKSNINGSGYHGY